MSSISNTGDYIERVFARQRILQFADLDEVLFGRILLGRIPNPLEDRLLKVEIDLAHIFPLLSLDEIIAQTTDQTFEYTQTDLPNITDAFNALTGKNYVPKTQSLNILSHIVETLRTRLSWLRDGDGLAIVPCVDSFSELSLGRFEVVLRTRHFIESLGHSIHKRLDLRQDFLSKVQSLTPPTGVSIDYKKELDLLMGFLRERQEIGGQDELSFTTMEMPFRHAVFVQGDVVMPSPGTCRPGDKPLLPLCLEASGLLDINHIGLCSSPTEPQSVIVKYAVRMPAQVSVFGASAHGLTPEQRRKLNEIELSIYARLHKNLRERYVFLGRPHLEETFAELSAWTLRQVSYCLEEPSFLRQPASEWLAHHADDARVLMEDSFFLPFLHERLYAEYGERIIKKPKKYGGEIDLLFDNIPIELKVRRGGVAPLQEIIDSTYRPAGQACAYAAQTRLAFVLVLDLPEHTPEITNLDSCFRVIERDFGTDFPTCIVVAIFHCHHPTPSRIT